VLRDCIEFGEIGKKFLIAVIGVETGLNGSGEADGELFTISILHNQHSDYI